MWAYGCEMAWEEDNRQVDNGAQHSSVTGMVQAHPASGTWAGYWH